MRRGIQNDAYESKPVDISGRNLIGFPDSSIRGVMSKADRTAVMMENSDCVAIDWPGHFLSVSFMSLSCYKILVM